MKIMFICHGNICRSPIAKYVLRDLLNKENITNVIVDSCATSREEIGNGLHYGTKEILDKYEVTYDRHSANQLTQNDLDTYDYLIYMDQNNLNNIKRRFKNLPEEKLLLFKSLINSESDIADPWYTGNFEKTYDEVVRCCEALVEKIKKEV